jgi:hypothetical protein
LDALVRAGWPVLERFPVRPWTLVELVDVREETGRVLLPVRVPATVARVVLAVVGRWRPERVRFVDYAPPVWNREGCSR